MKKLSYLFILLIGMVGCTTQKKLTYLNNLPEPDGKEYFGMEIPDYRLQPRDYLYITAKALTPEGRIEDLFSSGTGASALQNSGDAGGYLVGYDVSREGFIRLPVVGLIKVGGLTLEETKKVLQEAVDKVFRDATVDCKLLSFKFTVIGEVNGPGTYVNYNNYLSVLEALGRAGGISDLGRRDRILVVRPNDKGTSTFRLDLHDKSILTSEAYFLLPNDVVIVEPLKQKIFNLNMPTITFIVSAVTGTLTTTLLLINYFK